MIVDGDRENLFGTILVDDIFIEVLLDDMGLVRADFKEYLKGFPVKGGKTRASVLEQWEKSFSSSGEGFDMKQEPMKQESQEPLRTREHQERSVESILYDLNARDENAVQKGAVQRGDT